ncbi:MAG: hypothetical protein KDA38_04510 [Planctomycetales bacterium]|nr:hypothetical protein [Planctomycetales bacterium]
MSSIPTETGSRWPHRIAVLLVCVTFPLIWVGGLVTSYDAGMAVPDWPSTYGYNLFAYPWTTWFFGPWDLFIEHGHRLLGAAAGMVCIALVLATFVSDTRGWVRAFSVATLAMVIGQGTLGGMRVLLDARQVAMLHGITGPVFFAMATAMAVFTSPLWRQQRSVASDGVVMGRGILGAERLHRLGLLTVLFAYIQLVLGAQLRHVPVDASPSRFNVALMFHLGMAFVLAVHVLLLAIRVYRLPSPISALRRPATALVFLLAVQIGLGSATWVLKYAWPSWMTGFGFAASHVNQADSWLTAVTVTAHVAMGSLILVTSLVILLRSLRLAPAEAKSKAVRTLAVGWIA